MKQAPLLCILFDDIAAASKDCSASGRVVADIGAWSSAQQFIVCPKRITHTIAANEGIRSTAQNLPYVTLADH